MTARKADEGRSRAEWVTFTISCLVLAVLVGLLSVGLFGDERAATPGARIAGPTRQEADGFHVPVEVHNTGGEAAADVQVVAELTIDGTATEGDLVVDFLAGGEHDDVVFVFPDDPAGGDLVIRVAGYREP